MKKIVLLIPLMSSLVATAPLSAAEPANEPMADNTQLILQKLRTDKKLLVADNMGLTESEATAFWPIYEDYQAGLAKINRDIAVLVTDYGQALTQNNVTDTKARTYINQAAAIDQSEVDLRRTFAGKLVKVLPETKVARYLQIEGKIRAMLKNELLQGIPLVP